MCWASDPGPYNSRAHALSHWDLQSLCRSGTVLVCTLSSFTTVGPGVPGKEIEAFRAWQCRGHHAHRV